MFVCILTFLPAGCKKEFLVLITDYQRAKLAAESQIKDVNILIYVLIMKNMFSSDIWNSTAN